MNILVTSGSVFFKSLLYSDTVKLGDKERFDKENLALRNNFRVTKKILITKSVRLYFEKNYALLSLISNIAPGKKSKN